MARQTATFDHAKDWHDISRMIFARPAPLDFGHVRGWLVRIDDDSGGRIKQLENLTEEWLGNHGVRTSANRLILNSPVSGTYQTGPPFEARPRRAKDSR